MKHIATLPLCALFIFYLLISLIEAYNVNYIPTDSCALPPGCNFSGPIWDMGYSSINSSADVFINSTIPITITIYGDDELYVQCNSINLVSNVKLVFVGSSLIASTFQGYEGTSLDVIASSLSLVLFTNNGTTTISNSSIIQSNTYAITYDDLTCMDSSLQAQINWKMLSGTQTIVNCQFQSYNLYTSSFFATGINLRLQSWYAGTYTAMKDSVISVTTFAPIDKSTHEFTDCNSEYSTVQASNQTTISFFGTNSTSSQVSIANYFESTISHLVFGDYVDAQVTNGDFHYLVVGNQTQLVLSGGGTVYGMSQLSGSAFIQIQNDYTFDGKFSISADIYIADSNTLYVQSNVNIIGNHTLSGTGSLSVDGTFSCRYIDIPYLMLENVATVNTDTLTTFEIVTNKTKVVTINGNVVITPDPSAGLILAAPVFINGNFTQQGGCHNFTLNDYVTLAIPYLMVNGYSIINGTDLTYHLSLTTQKKWWLLHVNQSGAFHYASMGFDFAHVDGKLSISPTDIYLTIRVPGDGIVIKYTWAFVLASIILAITLAFVFHIVKMRKHRVEYVQIRDGIMGDSKRTTLAG